MFLAWHHHILWLSRFDQSGDLVGVGWVSCIARGTATGVKQAQAAYLAATK